MIFTYSWLFWSSPAYLKYSMYEVLQSTASDNRSKEKTFLEVEKHLAHERESRCCPDPQVAHAQREMAIPCNYTKNNTGFCLKFAQTDLTIAKNLLDIGQLLKILVNSRQQWLLGFNPWVWDCCVVFCRAKKRNRHVALEAWNRGTSCWVAKRLMGLPALWQSLICWVTPSNHQPIISCQWYHLQYFFWWSKPYKWCLYADEITHQQGFLILWTPLSTIISIFYA